MEMVNKVQFAISLIAEVEQQFKASNPKDYKDYRQLIAGTLENLLCLMDGVEVDTPDKTKYFNLIYERETKGIDSEILEDALFSMLADMDEEELKHLWERGY